ncbi:MAG: hypothetical protein AB2A00_39930 [Myxococcota bacterium]
MLNLFILCATVGFTFLAGSLMLGHILDSGEGHDGAEHVHDGLPILGPASLSALLCGFGCGGFLGIKLGLPELLALVPAVGLGAVMWIGSAFITRLITRLGSGGRSAKASGYVGEQATVTVAIPEHGVGEVTFTSQGEVVSAPARSNNGGAIPSQTVVTIEEMVEGVAVVGPSVDQVLTLEERQRAAALNAASKQNQRS